MKDYKEYYTKNHDENIPIFHMPHWLDIVAPNWKVAIVKKNNEIIASMPYWINRNQITMPPLTQFLGPYIKNKNLIKISEEHKLLKELEKQMPKFSRYEQRWQYLYTNWLTFFWRNYKQTSKYTYIIDGKNNEEILWKNIRSSTRSDINKSKKQGVEIKLDLGFDKFYKLIEGTFAKQNMKIPYNKGILKSLIDSCKEKKNGEILFAVDKENNIMATSFLVWDNYSTYYILSGIDDKFKKTGASSFLMWESILYGLEKASKFDFEGSMFERIETFFRSFGTEQRIYFEISKISSRSLKIRNAFSEIKKALKNAK